MESWRRVWRDGIAPLLSAASLEALYKALVNDDPGLIQGATTTPPPMQCVRDWPVESACALGYCGWRGDGLETVEAVGTYFSMLYFRIDQRLGEPSGCRHFLTWYDNTPRDEMRRLLGLEVLNELRRRWAAEGEKAREALPTSPLVIDFSLN